jgi:hypothetical protein
MVDPVCLLIPIGRVFPDPTGSPNGRCATAPPTYYKELLGFKVKAF